MVAKRANSNKGEKRTAPLPGRNGKSYEEASQEGGVWGHNGMNRVMHRQ